MLIWFKSKEAKQMTYTKFEVKNKNSKAVIPEYSLILPEAQPESLHQGDTAVAQELTQPSAVQQNPPQSTGPVFMCNQSGFDIPSDTKKITSFYTVATVLSICIFVFLAPLKTPPPFEQMPPTITTALGLNVGFAATCSGLKVTLIFILPPFE